MDLIYMNNAKEDIGVLQSYELDMAFGSDENTFECNIKAKDHCCEAGHYLYIEGTEYGGIIDTIQSKTGEDEVIYSGRTWHGIIGSKIILPLLGGEEIPSNVTVRTQDSKGNSLVGRYLIVSGDANKCIGYILARCGLSDLFEAPSTASGITINAYQFHRFTDAYTGLNKMLASAAGAKLKLAYQGGKIIVEAAKRYDYSEDDSFDSDLVDFRITKRYRTVNHLICLGSGELENRMVVHLYADADGNISRTQTQFGLDEYCATYDYSAIESEEELIQSGTDELKSLWEQDSLSMDYDESMDSYDVGDIVGARDNITGVSVASAITKKIVTIRNGKITIDLSTDAVTASGSGATGDGEAGSSVTWENIAGKPDAFPPEEHAHSYSDLLNIPGGIVKSQYLAGAATYANGATIQMAFDPTKYTFLLARLNWGGAGISPVTGSVGSRIYQFAAPASTEANFILDSIRLTETDDPTVWTITAMHRILGNSSGVSNPALSSLNIGPIWGLEVLS